MSSHRSFAEADETADDYSDRRDDRGQDWDPDDGEGEDDFDDLDPDPDDPIPGENVGLDFDDDEPEPDRGDFWPENDDDEQL